LTVTDPPESTMIGVVGAVIVNDDMMVSVTGELVTVVKLLSPA
jgi:hypothetical protein